MGVVISLGVLLSACSAEVGGSGAGATVPPRETPFLVTALGDSIPAATNCDGCSAFVDLFAHRIGQRHHRRVDVANLGVAGATSADLLDSLALDPDYASVLNATNVLTVTIGANDFFPDLDPYFDGDCDALDCFDEDLVTMGETLGAVLREVSALRSGNLADVLVTGYWNVFPDGAVAEAMYGPDFVRDSATLTKRANDVIESAAAAAGATYVDLVVPFKGVDGSGDPTDLLADDGDHPNQAGHEAISDALWAALAPGAVG